MVVLVFLLLLPWFSPGKPISFLFLSITFRCHGTFIRYSSSRNFVFCFHSTFYYIVFPFVFCQLSPRNLSSDRVYSKKGPSDCPRDHGYAHTWHKSSANRTQDGAADVAILLLDQSFTHSLGRYDELHVGSIPNFLAPQHIFAAVDEFWRWLHSTLCPSMPKGIFLFVTNLKIQYIFVLLLSSIFLSVFPSFLS